jgi:hypothetical protein
MHVDRDEELEYIQIVTNLSSAMPLEISGDHFLYLHNDKVVRARAIQVGDILKGDEAVNMTVTHIKSIHRQGLYAPATENGKIWVSGVTASSYISLIDEDIVSTNMQARLSHMALSPLRILCTIGSFSICQNETYSDDGYSMNLWNSVQFGHHFKALAIHMKLMMLIVVVPLLCTVSSLEMAVNHGILMYMLTVGLVAISKMNVVKKPKISKLCEQVANGR